MRDAANSLGLAGVHGAATVSRASMLPFEARGIVLDIDGARLIDGIDLVLRSSGVTVVMGPNGAGKSLLLRLMHGLIAPSSGSLTWGGQPVDATLRRRQAMVFQRPVLLRRSVAGNVDFALKVHGVRNVREARQGLLGQVGLLEHARQAARALSGGEQQRLALARALAGAPEVLFLDEATASLDPQSIQMIEQIVRAACEDGTKVVFVTHDVGQARRLADEVVFLHRGKLVEQAGAKEFFKRPSSRQGRDYLDGRLVL